MWTTKVVAAAAALGNMLNGWDSAALAGALLYIEPEFNLDVQPALEGSIAAASLVGAAISSTFAGSGADWLGRRKMLCIAATVYCIGSLVMLWSPNVYMLLAARLIDGIGVGLAVTTAPLYISEVSPAEIRGELNTLPQLLGTGGMFLAYCMVFGISLTEEPTWRMMLGIIFIPSLIFLILSLVFLPESPRWLVSKGMLKEAKQVLQLLRGKEDVSGEMALLVEGLGVGEDTALQEYIIQPADIVEDIIGNQDGSHINIFNPEDGTAWIAKPITSFTGSQGVLSRAASIIQQTTPRLGSVSFVDPMVGLIGSLKSTFPDQHFHRFGSVPSTTPGHYLDHEKWDEENQLNTPANSYQSEDGISGEMDGGLTSPLLSKHTSHVSEDLDLHRADSVGKTFSRIGWMASGSLQGSFTGSIDSGGIGGGWQLAYQWTGFEGTECKPEQGTFKRVYLFQEASADGARPGSIISLPRFGSTQGEVDSIPAAALISRPSQYGKDMVIENQVGPAFIHPAETATPGPAWSELLEGGVQQALIVGVTMQVLEQFGGINAVLNFTPEILQESGADVLLSQVGIGSDSASILASAATNLVALPFIVIAMRYMDILGRRKILLLTLPVLVLSLLSLIIINIVPTSDAVFSTVSVASVAIYVICFMTGFGPIPNMLCAEIFPTRVRGVCTGICQAVMWITNILVTELFPILDSYLGIARTFAFFAAFCFIAWIFVFVKIPETKGMPLEVIVEFFAMSAGGKGKVVPEEVNGEKTVEA